MAPTDKGLKRPLRGVAIVLALLFLAPVAATSEEADWLPPGSTIESTLTDRPARWIESELHGGHMGYLARVGELVFRSPLTLGREAARKGLSCDACHPNGAANTQFFITGISNIPGTVDVTKVGSGTVGFGSRFRLVIQRS